MFPKRGHFCSDLYHFVPKKDQKRPKNDRKYGFWDAPRKAKGRALGSSLFAVLGEWGTIPAWPDPRRFPASPASRERSPACAAPWPRRSPHSRWTAISSI